MAYFRITFFIICTLIAATWSQDVPKTISCDPTELEQEVFSDTSFRISFSEKLEEEVTVFLTEDQGGIVDVLNWTVTAPQGFLPNQSLHFHVKSKAAGHEVLIVNTSDPINWDASDIFVRVAVKESDMCDVWISIFGWIYFICWSLCQYPQVYTNFKKRSVVGYNFDFCILSAIGHSSYAIFNCNMYFNDEIQRLYLEEHKFGIIPVEVNDVVFTMNSTLAASILITQCIIYERGGQRVSLIAIIIAVAIYAMYFITLFISIADVITWLRYVYLFSYVKLFITVIKYSPQAYLNYKRKSTKGFNVMYAILDFIGGPCSILQMILSAYNYDDWKSIFGNPTKFLLGVLALIYDSIFLVQHFILYRPKKQLKKLSVASVTSKKDVNDNEYPSKGSIVSTVSETVQNK